MAMTHNIELVFNGTNLNGEIDLSVARKYAVDVTGTIETNEAGIETWRDLMNDLSVIFCKYDRFIKLEINEKAP